MRKDLFDQIMAGFEDAKKHRSGEKIKMRVKTVWDDLGFPPKEAVRLESVYLARRTAKLLQQQPRHLDFEAELDAERLTSPLKRAEVWVGPPSN